ncbi:hypothetical protein SERLA73DRAFT_77372 [Serpula lacrymans var. lacrymans S7.3]|uniref:Sorbose reductase sou1 n=2 Tax=Serpula lacrymans var. lacrymans TaxID=341189 RepID=F8Q9S7_SERL3|nr:uncharacterized protein SERLADRAFT_442248 [Serpula lacrymans var. lacrymans S7.9]EGN95332.1 hypothetical protein SERLA73DRAFT_77372 [Serpula lacrymans var. lacrymans S7.3]EGO20866.1 hypothetical protein SERLADRAFT_442248 [Serpula lacrymans var. lacrymans S7.9]
MSPSVALASPIVHGVAAILNPQPAAAPQRAIFSDFAIANRVAVITGGHRGLGLEMALALAEAGAVVYCLDLPSAPDSEWLAVKKHIDSLPPLETPQTQEEPAKSRLEYLSADVTDQTGTWDIVQQIVDKEGRVDICVAAAGIVIDGDCLEYPADNFQKVMNVNVNGVLFAAQAVGRQMARLGIAGSIILIASMSGSVTNKGHRYVSYGASKSAVLQMGRSMACELGPMKIRVNTISPGYMVTKMSGAYLDKFPHLAQSWSDQNPLGRLGRPDELRGVVTWLASDASSFCTGSDIIVDGGHTAW